MPYNHSIKAASPSGTAYTGRADGLFSLNEQVRFKSSGLWATAISAPSAPTVGTATATGITTATVAYTAPASNGGSNITSYTATSSPGGITGTLSQAGSGTITVSGLLTSTSYTFTVTATNSIGVSPLSAASNSITTLAPPPPTTIGQSYGGGFYAGKISTSGNGVATHYLIVAPKATGQALNKWCSSANATTGVTSVIDGITNTNTLYGLGSTYEAATFCKTLTIGGYSDWYLPSVKELEILYYFLRPTADSNYFIENGGFNAYAVSPQPNNTNYTDTVPGVTVSGINFRAGESEAFDGTPNYQYWTSTEGASNWARIKYFGGANSGHDGSGDGKTSTYRARAVRRVAV